MKKILYSVLGLCIMMPVVSCQKENVNSADLGKEIRGERTSFVAVAENAVKTTIQDSDKEAADYGKVSWAVGDQVKFVYEIHEGEGPKTPGYQESDALTADDIVDGAATFTADLPVGIKTKVGTGEAHLYAVYPASVAVDYSDGSTFKMTVPDVQDGTFANASIAVSKLDRTAVDAPLEFKNFCGLFRVTTTDANVRKLIVTSKTDIAGLVNVTFTGPAVKKILDGKKEITVNVNGAGTYYIASLPGNLDGVNVYAYDENDALIGDASTSNTISLARAQMRSMGTIGSSSYYFVKVEAAGNKDGSSWDNAADYASLSALLKTNVTKKVLMAAGTYETSSHMATGTANTSANFTIQGGYPSDAVGMSITGRDITNNATIISAKCTTASANRIWVIQRGIWKIDGITFRDATRSGSDTGSALVIEANNDSKITVSNCAFKSNTNSSTSTVSGGGAVRVSGTTVTMNGCLFEGNKAENKNGGAIYVNSTGTLNLNRCTFIDNTAAVDGGAIYATGDVNIVDCDFEDNSATQHGGAIALSGSTVKANRCALRENKVTISGSTNGGGAIYATSTGKLYINASFFANNADEYNAHVIYSGTESYVGINNCVIRGPWALTKTQGSLLQIKGSNVIVNSTILCQTGSWGTISLGSKVTNGCRIINDIVINTASTKQSFYATSYYMQVYNTIYSEGVNKTAGYSINYTDCLGGALCKKNDDDNKGNFPSTESPWFQSVGEKFNLDAERYFYIYPWEGTTTLGTITKTSLSKIKTLISGTDKIGPDFLAWLESDELKVNGVEALAVDIRGVSRDESAMWPGSYQEAGSTKAGLDNFNVK